VPFSSSAFRKTGNCSLRSTEAVRKRALASAVSAFTYGKKGNLDIKNGSVMLASVLVFTLVGSFAASFLPNSTMGGFSKFMTLAVGIKFILKPVMTEAAGRENLTFKKQVTQGIVSGSTIGFICGFFGAGGGMMMLFVLTSILGYDLKTAVGTSVMIMSMTAFTGAVSHMALGGIPDLAGLVICVLATLVGSWAMSIFALKRKPKTLNRLTGVGLTILGVTMLLFNFVF